MDIKDLHLLQEAAGWFHSISGDDLRNITIVTFLSTIFSTVLAGVFRYFTHAFNRRTTLSNLYVAFSSRYNQPEMHNALVALTDYYKRGRDDFPQRWARDRLSSSAEIAELRRARRTVERFYFDIAQLYRSGYVSRRFASLLSAQWGINVYYQICTPMAQRASAIWRRPHILGPRNRRR